MNFLHVVPVAAPTAVRDASSCRTAPSIATAHRGRGAAAGSTVQARRARRERRGLRSGIAGDTNGTARFVERLGDRTLVYVALADGATHRRRGHRHEPRAGRRRQSALQYRRPPACICSTTQRGYHAAAQPRGLTSHDAPARACATSARLDATSLFVAPYLLVFAACWSIRCSRAMWLSLHKADFFGGKPASSAWRTSRGCSTTPCFSGTVWQHLLLHPADGAGARGDRPGAGAGAEPRRRARAAILRGVFFSSSVLSVTIVTLIWRLVFMPDGGLHRQCAARRFGGTPIAFLSDADLALPAIAITTIWWCIGLPMMLFLAALQQVPRELYEAAALDNAGRWRTLWRITLPSIRRTFVAGAHHRDRAAVPAVRPGAADDAGRAEQRVAPDRAVHLRSRLQALGRRLRRRGVADPVRAHPDRRDGAVLASRAAGGR